MRKIVSALQGNPGNLLALAVSAGAACVAPLQVFVLAYAFLGPLHYLTEIAWLRKKDFYFSAGPVKVRTFVWIAVALCAVASVDFYGHFGVTAYAMGFVAILSLGAFVRAPYLWVAGIAAAAAARFYDHGLVLLFAAILPTVLHVYVFTGLFMWSGAVRERKQVTLAWVNALLMIAIPAVLLMPLWNYPEAGRYWTHAGKVFEGLFGFLAGLLSHGVRSGTVLADAGAAGVLRFVAFIYLYHYLNWFTKTELLAWHRVSRRTWTWIGVIYCGCAGCYVWNFTAGFYLVNFLALLHIFLEFPLNWMTGRFLVHWVRRLGRSPQGDSLIVDIATVR